MKIFRKSVFVISCLIFSHSWLSAVEPVKVFIRAGESNRGREVHAHPRFLEEWKPLLAERGMTVDGALDWPTAEQLVKTDVVVVFAQDGGDATAEQQQAMNGYLKRGGGLVVLHTGAVSMKNPDWWRDVLGGAWKPGQTKWKEGPMDLYYTENQYIGGGHPITKGAANFHLDDEIYYDMELLPEVRVLATSYTPKVRDGKKVAEGGKAHIYDIQPQIWTYERKMPGAEVEYRAVTSIPGHQFGTFGLPQYRAVILRSISWAAKRSQVDEYVRPAELQALTYPAGGPQRPEETRKQLELHPDFNLSLVAAEPLINKPMNFDWAPDGSLWVAETPEYPNGRRGMRPDYRGREWKDHGGIDPEPGVQDRKAHDRISRLVDRDGDGVMEEKQVFFEGLDLVTGLVFHRDGVIVTQAPDILWLRDVDGDGKAEKVEKLYTGLGTGDTHAVINNPRWGWDGWIYATHGYSASNQVKNAKGEPQPAIGSGVVRFRPDGSAIEQFSSKGGNTWGLEITADNRVMWTQPTSGDLLMQTLLPERLLARGKAGRTPSYQVVEKSGKTYPAMAWEQLAYAQIDLVGSFTAAAGTVVYDGGSWPKEYEGDYFTTEPTINIVHHANLIPQGSSFTFRKEPGREETEFIRSKDMWWRPIEVRVGPDGAVYVGDFYNQAVIHNDTRGPDHNQVNAAVRPDRDHYYGRIWRLDHKNAKKLPMVDLSKSKGLELVKALEHPNRHVRMNASRLLVERVEARDEAVMKALNELQKSGEAEARIAAMWTKFRIAGTAPEVVAFQDASPEVRRNAALVAGLVGQGELSLKLLGDASAPVRLAALQALSGGPLSEASTKALVEIYGKLEDDFQRSAAVAAAAGQAGKVISVALDAPEKAGSLVEALLPYLTAPEDASGLVKVLAEKSEAADEIKRMVLESMGRTVKGKPEMTGELREALKKLLKSSASASALVLGGRWDERGEFAGQIREAVEDRARAMESSDKPEADRVAAANALIGMREFQPEVVERVAKCLSDEKLSSGSKSRLVQTLGETGEAKVGTALTAVFASLDAESQIVAFEQLLKRSEWVSALLDGVKAGKAPLANLGPANLARLRTYPDPSISKRAATLLDELNPTTKSKNEVIAKFSPVVEGSGGDVTKGKIAFTNTCAICHVFDGGGRNIGPTLAGMGTHGPGELLTAIVDPNREVDPSFVTWNFEMKDGQFVSGIIARENPNTITIRSMAGEQEIKVADLKSRTNTGRSLMPDVFDNLGAEMIRDIIAYMASVDGGKCRTLDMKNAYTTTTARGLYQSEQATGDTLVFAKSGTVNVGKIPFHVVAPEKSSNGLNVVVLKGGPAGAFSSKLPAKVEIPGGGFAANRLHVLGGVTGWGYNGGGDTSEVMKITVVDQDGSRESFSCRNGVEFADYIHRVDVPGSSYVPDLLKNGKQVRMFTKVLSRDRKIASVILESPGGSAAPTVVAVTAELAEAGAPLPNGEANVPKKSDGFVAQFQDEVPQPPKDRPAAGPRVLLVGGGSSHDFVKFFGGTDVETLKPEVGWVAFTQNLNGIGAILDRVDVLVLSANQAISDETQKALLAYVDRGGALIAHHPGTWYEWKNFPEWNRRIVGGGTRGHDKLGEFEVKVTAKHPITDGVNPTFRVVDELYHFVPDASETSIEVLATATSTQKPGVYPQVFVVKHPKAKIVGFTLGHDARAHDLPEYRKLLIQAVKWCAAR